MFADRIADGRASSQMTREVLPASKNAARTFEWFPVLIGWLCYFLVSDWIRTAC